MSKNTYWGVLGLLHTLIVKDTLQIKIFSSVKSTFLVKVVKLLQLMCTKLKLSDWGFLWHSLRFFVKGSSTERDISGIAYSVYVFQYGINNVTLFKSTVILVCAWSKRHILSDQTYILILSVKLSDGTFSIALIMTLMTCLNGPTAFSV